MLQTENPKTDTLRLVVHKCPCNIKADIIIILIVITSVIFWEGVCLMDSVVPLLPEVTNVTVHIVRHGSVCSTVF